MTDSDERSLGYRHAVNDVGDCAPWCHDCRDNMAAGLNPDGTAKEATPMTKQRPALRRTWPDAHPQKVRQLLRAAELDSDAVSMHTVGESFERPDFAVAVIKGRDVVRCFREWAASNGLLTPGKEHGLPERVSDGDFAIPPGGMRKLREILEDEHGLPEELTPEQRWNDLVAVLSGTYADEE